MPQNVPTKFFFFKFRGCNVMNKIQLILYNTRKNNLGFKETNYMNFLFIYFRVFSNKFDSFQTIFHNKNIFIAFYRPSKKRKKVCTNKFDRQNVKLFVLKACVCVKSLHLNMAKNSKNIKW